MSTRRDFLAKLFDGAAIAASVPIIEKTSSGLVIPKVERVEVSGADHMWYGVECQMIDTFDMGRSALVAKAEALPGFANLSVQQEVRSIYSIHEGPCGHEQGTTLFEVRYEWFSWQGPLPHHMQVLRRMMIWDGFLVPVLANSEPVRSEK